MRIFIYSSIILFCAVFCPVDGIEGPPVEPCQISGDTRIYFDDSNRSFPQICAYFNASNISISFFDAGLYFMSMCYNGNWAPSGGNSENFCYLSGYINDDAMIMPVYVGDIGTPKYTNFACLGNPSPTNISECGGYVMTGLCHYVSGLTCESCTSYTDCLGDDDSICNVDGTCSCKQCENGVCYVGGCVCFHGYAGDDCEDRICSPPCQNSGNCQDNGICECQFPYTGEYCETLMTCSSPCQNSGNCQDNGICECQFPYTGEYCEILMTCSPPCPSSSRCLVNLNDGVFSCCAGQIVDNICIPTTTFINNTTESPVTGTSSIFSDPILLGIVVFGVLFGFILLVSFLCLCLCIMVCFMMKNKWHKNVKPEKLDLQMPDFLERTSTIYTVVDERRMMDHGMPPALPPARDESFYVEMDSRPPMPNSNSIDEPSEKKTSHYEVEDSVLEAKTSLNREGFDSTTNYENQIVNASNHEEPAIRNLPILMEASSPNLLLKKQDSDWKENAYENQSVVEYDES
ncbi:tenascin-X [Oopsacas minuta]|uniref:Tenascin-X n=1 Tax=Oopsacas minuta TaxID=111878 RepID=A0AAV7K9I9_9METZ|nr:tenascin-X [Oopsacas minuta]